MKPPTKRPLLRPVARLVWAALCLLVPSNTFALDIVATSWTTSSPDGRYLFVSISPHLTLEQEQRSRSDDERVLRELKLLAQRLGFEPEDMVHWTNSFTRAGVTQLRQRYSLSGLYRNDGSTNPVWTTPHYIWPRALVANDGQHLVAYRPGRLSGVYGVGVGETVLAFYAQGKLTHRYTCGELIAFPSLLRWQNGRTRSWHDSLSLDDGSGQLTLVTTLRDRYVFDLATGRIMSSFRPSLLLGGLLVTALIAGGALALRAIRRRRIRTAAP